MNEAWINWFRKADLKSKLKAENLANQIFVWPEAGEYHETQRQ